MWLLKIESGLGDSGGAEYEECDTERYLADRLAWYAKSFPHWVVTVYKKGDMK